MKQLPLGVRLHDRAVFASFLAGDNGEAVTAARAMAMAAGSVEQAAAGAIRPMWLYLHGIEGSGKSHLLQAICADVPGSAYLPLGRLRELDAGALQGMEALPLVALDDPETIAGQPEWERGLFSLYNACQSSGTQVAVAARVPATELPVRLPDLRSRLAAMPHYALKPLDEAQQREALAARAAARGLQLPEETLNYLQRRFARDMASLYALLERLDAASLEAQRPLTVPFIRRVLDDSQ
jgi:DnaA family protein